MAYFEEAGIPPAPWLFDIYSLSLQIESAGAQVYFLISLPPTPLLAAWNIPTSAILVLTVFGPSFSDLETCLLFHILISEMVDLIHDTLYFIPHKEFMKQTQPILSVELHIVY